MTSSLRRLLLLVPSVLLLCAAPAVSQQLLVPYLVKGGIRAAMAQAKDSLGADARLVFAGTFGRFSQSIFSFEFNLSNGRSTVWGYTFYSPASGRSSTYGVLQVPLLGFQVQSLGGVLPLPQSLDMALDTSAAYFNSDKLISQLDKDSTYNSYRDRLPEAEPLLITLAHLVRADSLQLPNGFPVDQPLWTMTFLGGGDTTMTCFVAAGTGETFCLQGEGPTLAVPDRAARAEARLVALPNPSTGYVRVDVTIPVGGAVGGRAELYDERGVRVLELTEAFVRGGYRSVEFDASTLPSGVYYCRAAGRDWSGLVPVVVER